MNINDVAEAAGVSRGSVSNYLNNKKVSDKIKLKIEAAIKELNYIPNSSARDLRSKESKFVVFIIPTVWSPFFSELTYYIQNELNSSGYKMIAGKGVAEMPQVRVIQPISEQAKKLRVLYLYHILK